MRRTLVGMAIVSVALMVPFLVRADDQKIAEAIVTQIQEHMDAGRLKGFGIDLQVDKGVVELKGEVATTEQLDLILSGHRVNSEPKHQLRNRCKCSPE